MSRDAPRCPIDAPKCTKDLCCISGGITEHIFDLIKHSYNIKNKTWKRKAPQGTPARNVIFSSKNLHSDPNTKRSAILLIAFLDLSKKAPISKNKTPKQILKQVPI